MSGMDQAASESSAPARLAAVDEHVAECERLWAALHVELARAASQTDGWRAASRDLTNSRAGDAASAPALAARLRELADALEYPALAPDTSPDGGVGADASDI